MTALTFRRAILFVVWDFAVLTATFFIAPSVVLTEEPEPDLSAELPRIAPLEPANALKSFVVQPGMHLEQVAAEPLIESPVAIAFDADSRLYVVEMRDYSEQATEHLGRVKLLEDIDGDGHFDRSTIFADQLSWPTAIACWDGGVYVGAPPDVYYLKDTDRDGHADRRETVYTGFGRSNVQGLMNSFTWGLDHRIHGATSSSGADVKASAGPKQPPVSLHGRDFAFDPRTRQLQPTSGGAQHGLSFDDWGHEFVCSNSDHIQQVMCEDRYLARNPLLAVPAVRASIATDGPQAEVFRISPVEPWRIVRTRLRVSGAVPGPIEGGGRAAGYFTGATGVTIYRGNAIPSLRGMAIVGDVGSNLVHRKRLVPHGLQFSAERVDAGSELVASRDIWFRPVQFANAPDGALYIIDMYREVIEHPASLPPVIKKHLDLTSGRDRGRIYRLVPDGFKQPPLPKLSKATSAELVALLAHENSWHRETAARLLFERQDRQAIEPLEQMAVDGHSPLGRMHAMYALASLDALDEKTIVHGLGDPDPRVREHAVRLAEPVANKSAKLSAAVLKRAYDNDLGVRCQLAFTLGELADPDRVYALADVAAGDCDEPWARIAVQSSVADGADALILRLLTIRTLHQRPGALILLRELARQLAIKDDFARLERVWLAASQSNQQELADAIVLGFLAGRKGNDSAVARLLAESGKSPNGLVAKLITSARATADNAAEPVAKRVEAIERLGLAPFAESRELFTHLLDGQQPPEVQLAAVHALASVNDPAVSAALVDNWTALGPTVKREALEALFARPERAAALLDAIEKRQIAPAEIDAARAAQFMRNASPDVRDRAKRLLASAVPAARQEVLERYRSVFTMHGEIARGRVLFTKHCAACHKLEGAGNELGPNLATVQNRGAESILVNVLDPNREVNPQYVSYICQTLDGRSLTGILSAETATSVTLLRAAGAQDVVLRSDIEELRSTGKSLMPEGFERELDPPAVADLLAYLLSVH